MSDRTQLFARLVRGHKLRYLTAIAAMLTATLMLFLAPLVPGAVIDGVLAPEGRPSSELVAAVVRWLGGRELLLHHLWIGGLAVLVATAAGGALTYVRGRISAVASESIVRGLRDDLYDHIQHLPARTHDQADPGDLVQRCTSDVETLATLLATQVVEIGHAVAMVLVALPLMLAMDAWMTLVSLVLLPPLLGFGHVFFRRVQFVFQRVDEAEGRLSARLQENLTAIRVVRAFARQDHECRLWAERIAEYPGSARGDDDLDGVLLGAVRADVLPADRRRSAVRSRPRVPRQPSGWRAFRFLGLCGDVSLAGAPHGTRVDGRRQGPGVVAPNPRDPRSAARGRDGNGIALGSGARTPGVRSRELFAWAACGAA